MSRTRWPFGVVVCHSHEGLAFYFFHVNCSNQISDAVDLKCLKHFEAKNRRLLQWQVHLRNVCWGHERVTILIIPIAVTGFCSRDGPSGSGRIPKARAGEEQIGRRDKAFIRVLDRRWNLECTLKSSDDVQKDANGRIALSRCKLRFMMPQQFCCRLYFV